MINPFRTLHARLATGMGPPLLALLVSSALSVVTLEELRRTVRASVGDAAEVAARVGHSRDAALRLVTLTQADLLGAGATPPAVLDSLRALADSLRLLLTDSPTLTPIERARVERFVALQGRVATSLAAARAFRNDGRPEAAFRELGIAARMLDTLVVQTAVLQRGNELRSGQAAGAVDQIVSGRRFWLLCVLAIGVLVTLVAGYFAWRGVTRPLERLVPPARALGRGDLRVPVTVGGLDVEYRVVADAFNQTLEWLRQIVVDAQQEGEAVARAAEQLSAAAEQAAEAASQISTVMTEMARDGELQRVNLTASEDLLHEAVERAAALDGVARESRALGSQIESTARQTRSGLVQAGEGLGRARDVIGVSGEAVARLQVASEAVEQFVHAVRSVADQTQLLSLNAAIEAARAGEYGRGFAVVAEEVRKLAASSGSAAAEVQAVVDGMRTEVTEAASMFRRGVAGLGDVGSVSATAATALDAIDAAVLRVEEVAAAVSAAADATRESVRALETRLGATTQHAEARAAAGEQAAAGAQQTAATSQQLAATVAVLRETAGRLNAIVSRFQV